MGLPTYLSPSDGGILCVILVGTAISITMVKNFLLSILYKAGLRNLPVEEYPVNRLYAPIDFYDYRVCLSETYMKMFQTRIPTIKFGSLPEFQHFERECSVCLTEFENDDEINHLSCGHVFHKKCFEKWLNYWNVTCPLCQTRMVPQEDLYM